MKQRGHCHAAGQQTEVCEARLLLTVDLNGTIGDDAFVLDYSTAGAVTATISTDGGPVTPLGTFPTADGVQVLGEGGTDSIRILGTTGNDIFAVTSTGLTVNGSSLNLNSVEVVTIAAGTGDDRYRFDADAALGIIAIEEDVAGGQDIVDFSPTSADVTLSLNLSSTQVVNANLSLSLSSATTFEDLIGGAGGDTLIGNSAGNILIGSGGDDTLTGGDGDDVYHFATAVTAEVDVIVEVPGEGTDTLNFSGLTLSVNVNLSSPVNQSIHTNRTLRLSSGTALENIIAGSGN